MIAFVLPRLNKEGANVIHHPSRGGIQETTVGNSESPILRCPLIFEPLPEFLGW